jgi:hypothetical protein
MLLEGQVLVESAKPGKKSSPDLASGKRQKVELDGTKRRGS